MSDYDPAKMDWLPQESAMPALIEHWRSQPARPTGNVWNVEVALHGHVSIQVSEGLSVADSGDVQIPTVPKPEAQTPAIILYPDVLLQAEVVVFGDRTAEGQIIAGVAVAWGEIITQLVRDPEFLFKIGWRQLEEIIAGAYEREGWPEVVLTPRRGDRGRDVVATRPGVGSIRIVDQVKAYKPGRRVTAEQVRSMVGVLRLEGNVSKGIVTTTGKFAPGIEKDARFAGLMPYRLELKNGQQLLQWLIGLSKAQQGG